MSSDVVKERMTRAILSLLRDRELTPGEVRECAVEACVRFEYERPPRPIQIGRVTYVPREPHDDPR